MSSPLFYGVFRAYMLWGVGRPTPYLALLVFSGFMLVSTANAQSLPMGAEITWGVSVWTEPPCADFLNQNPKSRRIGHMRQGERVVVYELGRDCVRISPDFGAWLKRSAVRLHPSIPHTRGYLDSLRRAHAQIQRALKVTGCGVMLRKVRHAHHIDGSIASVYLDPGEIVKVYRQQPTRVSISESRYLGERHWLPKKDIQLTGVFETTGDPICRRKASGKWRLVRDGSYFVGPSKDVPVRNFFKAEEVVSITAEYPSTSSEGFPASWLQVKGRGWVAIDQVVPQTIAPAPRPQAPPKPRVAAPRAPRQKAPRPKTEIVLPTWLTLQIALLLAALPLVLYFTLLKITNRERGNLKRGFLGAVSVCAVLMWLLPFTVVQVMWILFALVALYWLIAFMVLLYYKAVNVPPTAASQNASATHRSRPLDTVQAARDLLDED